jgi:hypothetical protein
MVNEVTRARYIAQHLPDSWLGLADPAELEETSLEEDLLAVLKLNRHGETRSAIALLTAVLARLADQRLADVDSR